MGSAAAVLLALLATSPAPRKHTVGKHLTDEPVAFTYDFAQAQRLEVGGTGPTRVSVLHQLPMPVWGYGILRVSIDNSTGPSQTVQLKYVSTSSGTLRTVERAVEVRSGEQAQVALPVPASMRYGRLTVRAPGVVNGNEPGVYFTYAYRPQRVLLAIGSAEEFEQLAGQRPVNTDPGALVTPLLPGEAPSELAAYVGFDAVAVASGSLESLPAGAQRALEAYAASGGVLILGQVGRGTFDALPLLPPGTEPGTQANYGFGTVSLAQPPAQREHLYFAAEPVVKPRGVRPAYARRGFSSGAGVDDVLLPQALAPLGRFMIIILLFSLAIGPGSWWVARRRGPGALLVTIPGTAFVTCALIIGYSLIRDGFTVHASSQGLSLLDAPRSRVITVAMGAFYANLAPGKAVFPTSTAVISPWEQNAEQHTASVTWAEGARFGSDFLPSRSYREWSTLGVEPTRARLVVKPEGDGFKLQNALGARAALVRVHLGGRDWEARDVRDGGEARLVAAGSEPPELAPRALTRFASEPAALMVAALDEGQFVARLDGPGFAPLGGLALSHHESQHVVRGTVHR